MSCQDAPGPRLGDLDGVRATGHRLPTGGGCQLHGDLTGKSGD